MRLRRDKSWFLEDSVEYLGHRIDQNGLHATDSKLKAISDAPTPWNVPELRSFLGLLNYYGRFIPKLSSLLHHLHQLLCKSVQWKWSQTCEEAFKRDASAYGIGAVISHILDDGSEHPIAFASRTLLSSECSYAQVEKEALSLIFGVKKFHAYLYRASFHPGHRSQAIDDYFGAKARILTLAAARLQ